METGFGAREEAFAIENLSLGPLGTSYCANPVPNSPGAAGVLAIVGTTSLRLARVELRASSLPAATFGFSLTSQTQADVTGLPGSVGRLCLGGAVGRFVGPGQVQSTGSEGAFGLAVDLSAFPQPTGAVAVQPGETWSFQAWHRDVLSSGGLTSNLTSALAVTFP
ncbi:MAG: hypothetical protein AAGG01_19010 [Planctomycetota bacterium]